MKFFLPITTLIASVLLATNVEAKWNPEPGLSWDYLIGVESDSLIKSSNKDVVTIDLEKAPGLVSYFHDKGQRVVCYFSGGTMQRSRSIDWDDYKNANFELSKISRWGNHYIDFRQKDKLQPLIKRRMQRARDYGCDGVEVDSIDHYNHGVKGYTKEDTITFGKWISETARSVGIAVGLKNSAGCASTLEPYFDFAVVESCADSPNVCNNFAKFTSNDKAVFVVHYRDYGYKTDSGSKFEKILNEAGKRGFSCVISNENLQDKSESFDCTTGSPISGGSHKKPITTTTTTTTTTVSSTATPTLEGNATVPGNATAPGNVTSIITGNKNDTKQREVGSAVGNNDNKKEEGGSGFGTFIAVAAAGGGIATAAVAGFVFLKKHKKFSSEDEEFNLENPKDEEFNLDNPKNEEIVLENPADEEIVISN